MFDQRRKGLGSLTETSSEPWMFKATKAGDDLTRLATVYGVSPQEIVKQNNIRWSSSAINAWVKAIGGKLLPSGWYVFTDKTQIKLPPHDRKDGEPGAAPPAGEREGTGLELASKAKSAAPKLILAAGFAAAAWVIFKSKAARKAFT